jgi:hypothetical protein
MKATRIVAGLAASLFLLLGCASPKTAGGPPLPAEGHFPPEGVDHLRMAVDLDVEIFGIGKDSPHLEGDVVVHRGGPSGPDGERMSGDLLAASLRGDSKTFGHLIAIGSPTQRSPCEYVLKVKGPGKYFGHFDINGWFFLPRHDLIVFTKKPVRVAGPAEVIPPVGQVAEAATLPIELYDFRKPTGEPVGSLTRARGKILAKVGIEEHLKAKETTVEELKSN